MKQQREMIFKPRALIKKAALVFVALTLACSMALVIQPETALGATTAKCTAKPNMDSGNLVQGAKETRITWEVQMGATEDVAAMTLTLPAGSSCSTENAAISTIATDNDKQKRQEYSATFTISGTSITATLQDPIPTGSYIRMVVYGVYFPAAGGDIQLTAQAKTTAGTIVAINDIPTIAVESMDPVEAAGEWINSQPWAQAWNSNTVLNLFLNPGLLVRSFPVVLKGFLMSLGIVLCAFPLAIPFGLMLALMRLSKHGILRGLGSFYVNIVRGTPLFLQIYIAFFGLPMAGINIPNFPLGVLVLCLNSAAYMCEIFRAGILSIPKGQFEAAESLGMKYSQTMLFVILPQMVKRVIPTLTSEFILLYKDTSLLAAVGVMEVVMYAKTIVATTGSITPYIVAALFYLVITIPLAKVAIYLENKLSLSDGGMSMGGHKKRKRSRNAFGKKNEDIPAQEVQGEQAESIVSTMHTVEPANHTTIGIDGKPLRKPISTDQASSL